MSRVDELALAFRQVLVEEGNPTCPEVGQLAKYGSLAVPPLIRLLTDDVYDVREHVARTLGNWSRDERIINPLLRRLHDPSEYVRAAAASSLGHTGDVRAVGSLIQLLSDPSAEVRRQTIHALAEIGTGEAVQCIAHALMADPDVESRNQAAKELIDLNALDGIREAIDRGLIDNEITVAQALGLVGGDHAFEYLVIMLRFSGDPLERKELTKAILAESDDDEDAHSVIFDLVEITYDDLQREAALSLARLGDPRAVGILYSTAVNHKDWVVRYGASEALWYMGDGRAVDLLTDLLPDRPRDTYISPSEAVLYSKIRSPRLTDVLISMLGSDADYKVDFACHVFYRVREDRALEPLIRALDQGSDWAALALSNYPCDERALDALIRALDRQDARGFRYACKALSGYHDVRAAEALVRQYDLCDNCKADVLEALGMIGDPIACDLLARAVRSEDVYVRGMTAWALSRMCTPAAEEALLGLLTEHDVDAISWAYAFFLGKGLPESEVPLLDAVACRGHRSMVEDYASCGNPKLEEAGQRWLANHPNVKRWKEPAGVKWGSAQ